MADRLSVDELARRLGIDKTTVHKWGAIGVYGGIRLRIDGPRGGRSVSHVAWGDFQKHLRAESMLSALRPTHKRVIRATPYREPRPADGPDLATGGSGKG